jgi:hypothetical protein
MEPPLEQVQALLEEGAADDGDGGRAVAGDDILDEEEEIKERW